MTKRLLVVILFVVALVGAACGGDEGGSDATGGSDNGGDAAATSTQLTAADFQFQPSDVTVAAGGSIEFVNEDDAKHSFTASDANIDQDVDPKASATVDVADAEPGTYDYVCKYHSDMTGTLEITE